MSAAARGGETDGAPGNRAFLGALTRAFGGAIVFALPLLLTMEMWWLGFTVDPARLGILLVVLFPMLVGLSYRFGFEATDSLLGDVVDALVAIAVGAVVAAAFLTGTGVIDATHSSSEIAGKIAMQIVPASIGALLAESLLGADDAQHAGRADAREKKRRRDTYPGELFVMSVGALFLALPVAPTEEIVMIAYELEPLRELALVLASLALTHAFVYGGGFRGTPDVPEGTPGWSLFVRFTVVGYVIALAVSAYVLWTFGYLDGTSISENVSAVVVLSAPASIGAAAARLIVGGR